MTDAGYLHLRGYCFGNTLIILAVSHAECSKRCTANNQCHGYVYNFPEKRPFKAHTCVLKKKMSGTPLIIKGYRFYSYYPVENEGRLLYLRVEYIYIKLYE